MRFQRLNQSANHLTSRVRRYRLPVPQKDTGLASLKTHTSIKPRGEYGAEKCEKLHISYLVHGDISLVTATNVAMGNL
jgi:hypothetical protein